MRSLRMALQPKWVLHSLHLPLAAALLIPLPAHAETLRYHTLLLDSEQKILPWHSPAEHAYDHYLKQLWKWLPTVPNGPSSSLPMYYLYCGFKPGNPITPDNWENDWGERIPNFVAFGLLYYAYTGDAGPLDLTRGLADYALAHGLTPANYAWPNFPYGTANAGSTTINGENVAWGRNQVLVDLGSDMGASFYKLYLFYGSAAYRIAAINVADTLASKIRVGDAYNSPWPYVVDASNGAVVSRYTSNFAGALTLFDLLIEHGEPNSQVYAEARQSLRNWILRYPMRNGNWVDGHSDIHIDGVTNWSNTSKSNMSLYLLDHPDFDPDFLTDMPALLRWTEDNMVNVRTSDGLPGQYYGAAVVAEQFAYMMRMGYQTSRLAAEYAGWYAITGDETYKDKAYRGFNYSTYMMKDSGESSDGPTDSVGFWWGDVYGEGPRMFFYGFKAVPEWAPPRESHILYSESVLTNVVYSSDRLEYSARDPAGIEYLRLAFRPEAITLNGSPLPLNPNLDSDGYALRDLGGGDYAVTISRSMSGGVVVTADGVQPDASAPTVVMPATASPNPNPGTTANLSTLGADDEGEANLTYSWSTVGTPPAPVTFNLNGTNETKSTTVTLTRAGSYAFRVTITDGDGLTATSTAWLSVAQTVTAITVTPIAATTGTGTTLQFAANATDQFEDALSPTPSFAWSVAGGGTINSTGLFSAGASAGGPYAVAASNSGKTGSATVTITAQSDAAVLGNPVVGTGSDPSGANDINCWRFRADSAFIAKNVRINLRRSIRGRMKVAIYADNNGTPGQFLVGSNQSTNPASGWVTLPLTSNQAVSAEAYYWLAAWSDAAYEPRAQSTGGTARYIRRSYGTWPSVLTGTLGPYPTLESIYAY